MNDGTCRNFHYTENFSKNRKIFHYTENSAQRPKASEEQKSLVEVAELNTYFIRITR